MEFDLVKYQNRNKAQAVMLEKTKSDYFDLKQYLELAQMLRRVVGI